MMKIGVGSGGALDFRPWSTKAAVLAVEYCLVRSAVDCPQKLGKLGLKSKSAGARERRSVAFEVISGQEQSEPG